MIGRCRARLVALALATLSSSWISAQSQNIGSQERDLPARRLAPSGPPAPADADKGNPAGVSVRDSRLGKILVGPSGKPLYAMNGGQLRRRSDPAKFCVGPCAYTWAPFTAPAGAKPIGAWRAVAGAQGSQWAYGNNLVFTYHEDKAASDPQGHEFEDLWFAITYVPPAPPRPAVPPNVRVVLADGAYLLADKRGHVLFIHGGGKDEPCGSPCEKAKPFAAGLAGRGIGAWTVSRSGDRPQWSYRGSLVYVGPSDSPADLPASAVILRP